MKKLFLITAFVSAILLTTTAPGLAWSKSKKGSPTPAAAPDTSDKITAVHLTSIIINLYATHAAKEYKVTPETKITVNGQAGTISNLATGMDVVVTPAPNNPTAAATIDAKSPTKK
jgi:hypothetical protein